MNSLKPYQTTQTYWGWTVRITCDSRELFQKVKFQLPDLLQEGEGSDQTETVSAEFHLTQGTDGFELLLDGEQLSSHKEIGTLLAALENEFQMNLATNAPDAVFVHAGVVAIRDRCLVLPARSYSGKSTLVHALIKRGATYFSDEYAVIDKDGWVHPYRRPLTIRRPGSPDRRISAKKFPLDARHPKGRLALILDCNYKRRSRWAPERLTPGQGLLNLLSNTVSARLTPARDFQFLTAAIQPDTECYSLERGEAKPAALRLLALLNEHKLAFS